MAQTPERGVAPALTLLDLERSRVLASPEFVATPERPVSARNAHSSCRCEAPALALLDLERSRVLASPEFVARPERPFPAMSAHSS